MNKLKPLKTILALEFFPVLESSRIESVAERARIALEFGNWRKNPKIVDLIDIKRRERLTFESHRVSADIDSFLPNEGSRIDELLQAMASACEELAITKFSRMSRREWFAIHVEGFSEQTIFRKLRDRLFKVELIEKCLGAVPNDMAIIFESDEQPLWYKRRVEFGAMQKTEWRSRIGYPEIVIDRGPQAVQRMWIDGLDKNLPDSFVYIDIDTFWLAEPPEGKAPEKQIDRAEFFETTGLMNLEVSRQMLDLVRK